MGRLKGRKQTGRVAAQRREGTRQRHAHKEAIVAGTVSSDLPEPLVPELFRDIQTTYWECLKAIPDPRLSSKIVYPLYLILHRILTGFLGGARHIGVLFPKSHHRGQPQRPSGRRTLGGLPTRPAVYEVLRRIDWSAAHAALAPLWQQLGYTPDLVIGRRLRDPKEILDEFRQHEAEKAARQAAEYKAAQQAAEKAQGMSAAKALRAGRATRKPKTAARPSPVPAAAVAAPVVPVAAPRVAARQDLLLDGKVVRASYNMGGQERFVHVTAVSTDAEGDRHRFILGARPTVLDRNGEWGAALSILEALTPRPAHPPVVVSGDAGMCVEEHAAWLNVQRFGYLFRIKENAGHIFDRVVDWATSARAERPAGDLHETCRISGADAHSRRLWRLPGLRHASFPGIREGFVVEKKA